MTSRRATDVSRRTLCTQAQVQVLALALAAILAAACATQASPRREDAGVSERPAQGGGGTGSAAQRKGNTMRLTIGEKVFTATLHEGQAAGAFEALLPLTVKMIELNGNEKYARLAGELPVHASSPGKIRSGELMLYGASTLVLFYESFPTSYSYTRLGRVDDASGLAAALGAGDITVAFAR